ncbi:Bicyclomycin resistance protein [Vibrio aerogenes CECT 7868]|uniref:Bicyclomycin resistance protein n=1 Tax=Vibrio aerogenes CECT 7868 TaxID=1216006 RepID=A0A1M6A235_9VIBR|nr:multidrug effflux MFS transporter [Vibrio aerogenes]SHI30564.1 Bicyclomycin resistance protein [Vibrio aerogenes CECT 7868]
MQTKNGFNWRPVLLASLAISVGQLSIGLVFPSLPWIADDFSVSADQTQLLISAYLIGFGPLQFIYGPVSDSIGRRTVLLTALILSFIGLVIIVCFSHSFTGLILGRFIQGAGNGCCAVLSRASTRDSYSGDQLPVALSYVTMVASVTPIFAPVLGGFINHHLGWRAIFYTLLGYLMFVWCVLFVLFKETMRFKKPLPRVRESLKQYKKLLSSVYFLSFGSIGWLNFSLVTTCISLMPFLMQVQIGMSSDEYAMWALIPAIGMLLGSFSVTRLRGRFGLRAVFYLSPVVQLISALWFILIPLNPLMLMVGQFLMVFGNGIALPCAQAQLMLPYRHQAGMVAALAGGGQMIVAALVSFALLKSGINQAWHLGLVIACFASMTLLNIRRGFRSEVKEE